MIRRSGVWARSPLREVRLPGNHVACAGRRPRRRVLAFTTSGAGHFLPMLPLIGALRAGGHQVACCGPESFHDSAERAGLEFLARPDIPAERLAGVFPRMRGLSLEDGNRL